jgi:hypothetical protein
MCACFLWHDWFEPFPLSPSIPILQALVLLLAEEGDEMVLAAWKACEAVASTIPKENQVRRLGAGTDPALALGLLGLGS